MSQKFPYQEPIRYAWEYSPNYRLLFKRTSGYIIGLGNVKALTVEVIEKWTHKITTGLSEVGLEVIETIADAQGFQLRITRTDGGEWTEINLEMLKSLAQGWNAIVMD